MYAPAGTFVKAMSDREIFKWTSYDLLTNEPCKHYDASNRKRILFFSHRGVGGTHQVARAGYSVSGTG